MILMYLNMILLNCEAKVSFDFWTNFTYFGQSVQQLMRYKVDSTQICLKILGKDFHLLILREIQMDQNLAFIFHDRHIFLALLKLDEGQ